ncbi:inosine/xanthosine triphosphatase [Glaciecola sp. MF2-115]|uniref:inosine/xanthosine triphosphatase n=1 Tax=Glaciecola sp. MF2-115 TaxID=3384827 RepID=UPI0039A2FFA1
MKIIVASKNPVKIDAARTSFASAFPAETLEVVAVDAPSLVSEQPMSATETRDGAVNRVKYCQQRHTADYYVSYEGGVDVLDEIPSTYAVVCIANKDRLQTGRTASLPLPNQIYQKLKAGGELGPAMDEMFNTVNIKQKGGAIGQLSNGLETRKSIYVSATLLSLSVFFYPNLYD